MICKPCGSAKLSAPPQLAEQCPREACYLCGAASPRRRVWCEAVLEGNNGSTATNANQETWSWSGNQSHLDLGHGCEEVQKYSPVRYLCNTTSPMPSTEESRWTRHRRGGSAGRCQICKGIWGHGCDHVACNPPQPQSCPQLCQGQCFLSLSLAPVGKRGYIRPIWLSYGRSP